MVSSFQVTTKGASLNDITSRVMEVVRKSGVKEGLCTVFIQHTSASLIIQENADPTAKSDLESWLWNLVEANPIDYEHTAEGSDDMPSHIKSALTNTSLSIPILDGELALGTWQGIYIWEHRKRSHQRSIVIHTNA